MAQLRISSRAPGETLIKDVQAVVWISTAVFFAICLASYHPNDPSLNSIGGSHAIENSCGIVGSFLSDIFYQAFGLSAWFAVFGLVRLAWKSFKKSNEQSWLSQVLWGTALLLTTSSLLALHGSGIKLFNGNVAVGGVVGALIVKGLVFLFNTTGVAVLLWATATVLLVFYSEKTIQDWIDLFGRLLHLSVKPNATPARRAPPPPQLAESEAQPPGPSLLTVFMGLFKREKSEAVKVTVAREARPPISPTIQTAIPIDEAHEESDQNEESTQQILPAILKRRSVKLKAKVNRIIENWKLPEIALLDDPPESRIKIDKKEIEEKAEIIVEKLSKFDVGGEVVAAKPGPAVTLFEFRPNADVQLTQVTSRADDLALALSAESLRIIAPIPGRDVVGIETSNAHRETVFLKDILADSQFWKEETVLPVCLGREVDGSPRVVDLRSMPHMMVAGQTGSGKSVFVVSSITGFVFRHSPKTLRLVLIDPKQVDLTLFNNIPHLLMPPICEAKKAVIALRWGVREMEKRNRSFNRFKVRKLEEFNEVVSQLTREQIEEHNQINADLETQNKNQELYYFTPQPFIVYVVEEFGDLMMVDKNAVEEGVVRLTQMARAAGIHLILAMQTPRKEIVTGRIKTNIPGRVSFKVPGFLDSKIILDEKGAERLLGRGDMLFLAPGVSKPQRHHAPWLTNDEIERVVGHWSAQGEPAYDELAMRALEGNPEYDPNNAAMQGMAFDDDSGGDEMYDQILAWVSAQKTVSASLIQRKFGLGYPRASRLIDQFEKVGVIGPANGSKPRAVLIQPMPEP